MSDLFGNHIVGFPKRWLIYYVAVFEDANEFVTVLRKSYMAS